jgi:exosortase
MQWVWLVFPLGCLWFRLIDNLRLEWGSNPQYSYGFMVPVLMIGLLLRRWPSLAATRGNPPAPRASWGFALLCLLLAFAYLPTRLIEAATPEWRPLQWSLGIETTGLTLYGIYLVGGRKWLQQTAFTVLFFLVAVPWPSVIEQPIIQGLSRLNAAVVVNVLFVLGIPAAQHGNLIEVGTGVVGINDACSGIRSLQSSIMMSLFLGEFYRLNGPKRWLLLPVGFVLAMFLNVCRTSLLSWLVARKGIGAIAEYHDEAGMTVLLICSFLLWGAGWLLARRNQRSGIGKPLAAVSSPAESEKTAPAPNTARLIRFGITLTVWLAAVECGVQLWYHIRESHIKRGPDWSVQLPEQNPTYRSLPVTAEENQLLRFDEQRQGEWRESDGSVWQVFYYNWFPGRVAGYLAKRHTPDICLTATGYRMTAGPELMVMDVNHIQLPIRHYIFATSTGPLQVYQCHWEAGMGKDTYTASESARFNLIRGVWAGRGNQGQKVLEVIVSGYDNPDLARQALAEQLKKIIQVQGLPTR